VTERKSTLTDSGFRKIVNRAGKVAGIDFSVHPEMLRRSTGFELANDGKDTRAIQHYLGTEYSDSVRNTELNCTRFKQFWED
jgi:type 1 fimbriae regulatory protein FimB/type 1 fimbriae regulatory protein FimE